MDIPEVRPVDGAKYLRRGIYQHFDDMTAKLGHCQLKD